MTGEIIPDQDQAHEGPIALRNGLVRKVPIAKTSAPSGLALRQYVRQGAQDRCQFLLEPGMEDRIGRLLDRQSTDMTAFRMKQRQ